MKKVLSFSVVALLALFGCTKEQNGIETENAYNTTLTLSITPTKAIINDSDSGPASFEWETGDVIGVQVGNELKEFTFDSYNSDNKAIFKGSITGSLENGAFVAYPYVPQDCIDGNFSVSFPATYEVSKANAFRLRWTGKLKKENDGTFSTTMEHTSAILRVTYASVPDAVNSIIMTVDDGSPVTVNFTQDKVEHMSFYFPVMQGSYNKITVGLGIDGEIVEGTEQTLSKKNGTLDFTKGLIYRAPEISLNLYALMTPEDDLSDGTYVLAYYDASAEQFKLFSFEKTMANAAAAAETVKDVHGLSELLAKGSQIYSSTLKENYVAVSGKEGAHAINVPAATEAQVAFSATGNANAGKVSFTSSNGNIKADKIIVAINDDNTATIAAQFNGADLVQVARDLRGTDIPVTFNYLIDFAVDQAKKENVTFTPEQIDRLRTGFEHLCTLAKDVIKDKLGKDLMPINLQTNPLDVFARYYDNVCDYSLQISEVKKLGWATPIGFHKYDDGFTTNIALPSYGWFDRVNASLMSETKQGCVNYWAQFDDDYTILEFENFFSRAANKALSEISEDTYTMLHNMAVAGKFTAIGKVYNRYATRFNDKLEPVYIYKKVE